MVELGFTAQVQHFSGASRITIPKATCEAGDIIKGDYVQVTLTVIKKSKGGKKK